jgi:hypothetical protein
MKLLTQLAFVAAILSSVVGCSTDKQFTTRLPPPDEFNTYFQRYKELPGEKIMVVAVDPGQDNWAFAFDDSKDSLQDAAKNAAIKCDTARKKFNVFSKGKIFAINNDVVYYDNF